MIQESIKTISTRKSFNRVARKQAKFIADGGLKEEDGYSQINPKAWSDLKRINAGGFVTVDSQAGDQILERVYITGYVVARFSKICRILKYME